MVTCINTPNCFEINDVKAHFHRSVLLPTIDILYAVDPSRLKLCRAFFKVYARGIFRPSSDLEILGCELTDVLIPPIVQTRFRPTFCRD